MNTIVRRNSVISAICNMNLFGIFPKEVWTEIIWAGLSYTDKRRLGCVNSSFLKVLSSTIHLSHLPKNMSAFFDVGGSGAPHFRDSPGIKKSC